MSDERLFQTLSIAPGEGTFGENERLYYEALGRKWGEDLERRFLERITHPPETLKVPLELSNIIPESAPNPLRHPDAASFEGFQRALCSEIAASLGIPARLMHNPD